MAKLQVIVGGQFGSEGKGAIAGYLAHEPQDRLLAIRVAGPNAGHTVIGTKGGWGEGKEFKLQQVPVAAVTNREATLAIAAGSEIDLDILWREVKETELRGRTLTIDPEATIIEDHHVKMERGSVREGGSVSLGKEGRNELKVVPADERILEHGEGGLTKAIGSTGKGVGAARAERIMRRAVRWQDFAGRYGSGRQPVEGVTTDSVSGLAAKWLSTGNGVVMVEGTQGYGLGLHSGNYPYVTSSDCRAVDFLSMAGISPWQEGVDTLEVWVVLRTYPIRVAGNSGPLANETSWERLAAETNGYIQPERTTVTKKVRRIGEWDTHLAQEAIKANGGGVRVRGRGVVKVALTFFDYWFPAVAGRTDDMSSEAWSEIARIERLLGVPVELIGTGPNTVIDLRK